MNAHSERMVVVRMVSVQTLLDLTRVNVIQATPETDLLAQVSVGYCESAYTLACTLKHALLSIFYQISSFKRSLNCYQSYSIFKLG